ncbi:RNA polymerase II elongation factor Ell-like [Daphnia pulex]|uniref:RNA polymerase II elongation factor Ell-like n=1 Tax=Daphnia pulex TaxID=6669 RepID=UPI001EDD22D6|nr:RNA polymerase II elongation factor Ell-like [Daphnia pulex]
MAAFEEGVQYGLSAHGHSSENKSLVFVKLTDSSFKAIEEYLRIKLKTSQHPSVQFLGNEGRLWFPSAEEGRGSAFSFNLSSSSVAGGPQGSFECVQQCGYQSLESLGVMGLKMNIKAKDDVYEATRQRMAVAEEESKKNCTRVIKLACGPDIGRVVKIRKQAAAVFPPRRDRGDTSPPTSGGGGGVHPTSQHHHHHRGGSSSSLSSTTAPSSLSSSSLSSLYPSSTYHNSSSHVQQQQNGSGGGGLGRSSTSSPSLGGQRTTSNAISPLPRSAASPSYPTASSISSNSSMTSSSTLKDGYANGSGSMVEANPDLMKRPLRERLIHMLAIRSYKKPELVNRLHKEGLKEKDKKLIMNVLSAIGLMKDQAYHLARHIWNDVHDDWPFYTDQEKQILKRRKPQNLTPPVSDSSSGSGHSPPSSSLHSNGSPVGSSSSLSSLSAIHNNKTSASPNGGLASGGLATGAAPEKRERGEKRPSQQVLAGLDALDAAAVEAAAKAAKKQRISLYKKPDSSQSTHHHSSVPDSRNAQQQQMAPARSSSSLKVRPSPPSHHQQQLQQQQHYHNNNKDNNHHHQQQHNQVQQQQPPQMPPAHQQHNNNNNNNHHHNHHRSENHNYYRPGSLALSTSSSTQATAVVSTRVTSSTDGPDTPNSSPDSMSADHMMDTTDVSVGLSASTTPTETDSEPYTLQYRTIVSGEQRSRYKEDFNSQYNEYRNLHKAIDKVSKRFSHLEEELRQQDEGTSAWQRIKSQIVREYKENLRDAKYREAKRRFHHLHEKLAHIKRLVLEWDTTQTCRS